MFTVVFGGFNCIEPSILELQILLLCCRLLDDGIEIIFQVYIPNNLSELCIDNFVNDVCVTCINFQ